MATNGAARVAAANAQIKSNGGVSTQQATPSKASTTQTTNSAGTGYYKDAPGYVPGSSPTDANFSANGPISAQTQAIQGVTPQAGTTPIDPNAQAPQSMIDQVSGLTNQVNSLATQKGLTLQKNAQGAYSAMPDLKQQATQKLDILNQSGQQFTSGGQAQNAMNVTSAMVGGQQEAPSMWNNIYDIDPGVDKDFMNYDDLMSPTKQRQSLVQEYEQMSKNLGLEAINAELINDKRIIEGTEDDIRAEITGAGGTATASQVQAMGNARNKQLIKNYNTLQDTRNSLTTQLSTMMQLSVQDRQFAEAEFDRKLRFADQVMQFRERATSNARSGFNAIVSNVGYDGLYASTRGNPYEVSLIEKSLNLAPGGLAQLALAAGVQPKNDLQFISGTANQASGYFDKTTGEFTSYESGSGGGSGGSGGGGGSSANVTPGALVDKQGKPLKLTATQVDSLTGFDNTIGSANEAMRLINAGAKSGPVTGRTLQAKKLLGMQDETQLQLEQTLSKIKADFMKAISGAAVSESEAKRLAKLLPEITDQESVVKTKLKTLVSETNRTKENLLKTLGGVGSSSSTVVGPDGNEYVFTD